MHSSTEHFEAFSQAVCHRVKPIDWHGFEESPRLHMVGQALCNLQDNDSP